MKMLALFALAAALGSCTRSPPSSRHNPLEGAAPAHGAAQSGTVAEVIPAGPYRYVRVELDGGGSAWVATLALRAAPAGRVSVKTIATRDDFHSRRLDRTFDHLEFGVVHAE